MRSSMIKHICTLSVAMSAAFSVSAFASNLGVVTADATILRSYNAFEGAPVTVAYNNDTLNILADAHNNWYQVKSADGTTGFVNGDHFTVTQTDATCVVDGTNVYCRPTTTSAPYGTVNSGDVFVTTGSFENFYQIRYNGYTGYIEKNAMQGSLLNALHTVALPAGISDPVYPEAGKPVADSQVSENTEQVFGQVTAPFLNLREEPEFDARVARVLPENYYVTVVDFDGQWLKVIDDEGVEGYVSDEYISLETGVKPANEVSSLSPADAEDIYIEEENDLSEDKSEEILPPDGEPVQYSGEVTGEMIVQRADDYIGVPYVWGGTDLSSGVDCSGFVQSVYAQFDIHLNRIAADMNLQGTSVAQEDLQPGDLVFFNDGYGGEISHVGMYYGNGQYIHSTDGAAQGVTIADFNAEYPQNTYVGAKRILN